MFDNFQDINQYFIEATKPNSNTFHFWKKNLIINPEKMGNYQLQSLKGACLPSQIKKGTVTVVNEDRKLAPRSRRSQNLMLQISKQKATIDNCTCKALEPAPRYLR